MADLDSRIEPLSLGIDPPAEKIGMPFPENPIRSICKKCGKTHGMVVQDMKTGECEPLDTCMDCLMVGTRML